MSEPYNGRGMDRPSQSSKLAKRSRERGPVGLPSDPRHPVPQPQATQDFVLAPPPLVLPPAVASPRTRGLRAISQPTPAPQWPLPGPPAPSESYRLGLPPNRSRKPPKRPPRPSYVPLLVDQSPLGEPTQSFRASPSVSPDPQEHSQAYNPSSPPYAYPEHAPSDGGSSPEPLVPVVAPYPAPNRRRSVSLGPPPSSRRGQSSFYSNTSFVSPIPEEAYGFRSHESYASSSAMPDDLRVSSLIVSPGYVDTYYEESLAGRSRRDSATSTLVAGRSTPDAHRDGRQSISPVNPFDGASGSIDESIDTSNTFFTTKHTPATTPGTASNMLSTMPNFTDPIELRKAAGSPQPYSHISAVRRPPRLDMDAVRAAEARGSLTSLPDLIRRATRLAAMMEKGRRPASRLDELDFFNEKGSMGWENMDSRHLSSLSDMLAAFPPPVHTAGNSGHTRLDTPDSKGRAKQRRCCGLPMWGFILVILLMLCIITAAVVLPLEFFVFKNLGNQSNSAVTEESCEKTLPCLNGGTSVAFQNTCSCICTNGFTGVTCNTSGSSGCTTTNLVATDESSRINNVTLGMAIPRIIAGSSANFSIPLSGTSILAKFNSANLSCIAQNSLVTFDGQSTRVGDADAVVQNTIDDVAHAAVKPNEKFVSVSAITLSPSPTITPVDGASKEAEATAPSGTPTTNLLRRAGSSSEPKQTATFNVTEQVLDFARTAVLFVLEELSVDAANTAQTQLQQFFSKASKSLTQVGDSVTVQQASNLNIGGNYTIDLVAGAINLGRGPVGGKTSKRDIISDTWDGVDTVDGVAKPGHPTFPRGLTSCV